jgi:arachidonate 15-lipoxygenase
MSDQFSLTPNDGFFSDDKNEVEKAREVYEWYHDYLPPIPTLFNRKLGDGDSDEGGTPSGHRHQHEILLSAGQQHEISRLHDKHGSSPGHVMLGAIRSNPLLAIAEKGEQSVLGRIGSVFQKAAEKIEGAFSPYNEQTGVPRQEDPGAEYLVERGAFGFFESKTTEAIKKENPELSTPADYKRIYEAYLENAEKEGRFGGKVIGFSQLGDVFDEDMIFGWLRLAGTNPRPLTGLTEGRKAALLAKMALTDAHVAAIAGDGATIDSEVAASRLYFCDYAILDGIPTQEGRHMFPVIGVFWSNVAEATTRVGRQLLPVAIQLGQTPEDPLFTPADEGWPVARIHFSVADFNFHEMGTHLSGAHFAQEAFQVATRRNMRSDHPIGALLIEIYYGLLFNNALGRMQLVNPGGYTDRMMAGVLETGSLEIVKRFYTDVWHWDHWNLRTFLTERGTIDTEGLPVYPYRDDGLPLFDAIHRFATEYVNAWYQHTDDVAGDKELQSWVAELTAPEMGNLLTKGFPAEIKDRTTLSEVLARLIWQAGPGHGGINYSQFQYFAVVPSAPGAAYAVTGEIMDVLPALDKAIDQVDILCTITQKIFDGPIGTFDEGFLKGLNQSAKNAVENYQRNLKDCIAQVNERNASISRAFMPYPFLNPENLPNSTNI